jgi:hypothetical protein
MTPDTHSDIAIESTDEFEAALAAIVETAILNDIDVRGAWEFETGGSTHRWEINVVELATDGDSPGDEETT